MSDERAALPPRRAVPQQGRNRRQHRKAGWIAAIVGCLVVLLVAVDALVLVSRIGRVSLPPVTMAGNADPGETWVIVGSDNRADVPDGLSKYGSGGAEIGEHADIIIVVHQTADGTHAFAVPRDMWVRSRAGDPGRLTLMLTSSPDDFAAAMCLSLGIPVDHLVIVHMGAFIGLVNALGGIDIDFPHATRDANAQLNVPAGLNHLNGDQALAYVRSREPEYFIDGTWKAEDITQGAQEQRPQAATQVLGQVVKKLKAARNPVTWQNVAWALTSNTLVDEGTSFFDLPSLLGSIDGDIPVLPVSPSSGEIIAVPSDETYRALMAAGYPSGACRI